MYTEDNDSDYECVVKDRNQDDDDVDEVDIVMMIMMMMKL